MMHERYGKGNWKDIKIAYPDVFIDRTTVCTLFCIGYPFVFWSVDLRKSKTLVSFCPQVDMKDKFRNLERHLI